MEKGIIEINYHSDGGQACHEVKSYTSLNDFSSRRAELKLALWNQKGHLCQIPVSVKVLLPQSKEIIQL